MPLVAALALLGCAAPAEDRMPTPAAPTPTQTAPAGIPIQGTEPQPPHAAQPPVRVQVPAAGIDVAIQPVGVAADGQMELPEDPAIAGWYRFGPDPSDEAGTTVLAAHVDSLVYGLGPFAALRDTAAGAEVIVTTADDVEHRYVLESVQSIAKTQLPLDQVFDRAGAPRVMLITCGGQFDADTSHYVDNIVATAVPVDG